MTTTMKMKMKMVDSAPTISTVPTMKVVVVPMTKTMMVTAATATRMIVTMTRRRMTRGVVEVAATMMRKMMKRIKMKMAVV